MELTRKEALQYIHEHPEIYLQKAKHEGFICPICGSGSGPNGTGITTKDGIHFSCWGKGKCFKGGDIIDIIAKKEGLQPGSLEAFSLAYELYGINVKREENGLSSTGTAGGKASMDKKPAPRPEPPTEKPKDFTAYFEECHKRIGEIDYPHLKRGLTGKTIEPFNLGYEPNFKTKEIGENGEETYVTWKALIIPISPFYYKARNLNPEAGHKNRYRIRGLKQPFNLKALEQAEKPVFVVEGEIDALSIIEAGGEAVAIETDTDALLTRLKNVKQPLILALDKDEPGQEAEKRLMAGLKDKGIPYLQADITGDYKDANEAWNGPGAADFAIAVHAAQNEAINEQKKGQEAAKQEYRKNSVAAYIEQFRGGIANSVNTPFISTGFSGLDDKLEGGLYEGLYLLGAMPSLGKTTLALQMADSIAIQGQDVLIFSLEMARTELMAKSISRLTFLDAWKRATERLTGEKAYQEAKKTAKSNRGITSGSRYKNYSQEEKEAVERAITQYEGFTDNLFIEEGVGDISAEQMRQTIKNHIQATGKTPVCIIDYAQIMQPEDSSRGTDKQNVDKAVRELKRISRDFKNTVIAISSFNRTNYNAPVSYESFKESGGLEYGSDVVIGLQLKGTKKNADNGEADVLKAKEIREIELKILKNRNGPTGGIVPFDYYTIFNYFQEK